MNKKRRRYTLIAAAVLSAVLLFLLLPRQQQIRFKASDEALKNPLMGFAPMADSKIAVEDHSLIYFEVTWADLEPREGEYNFAGIDKMYQLEMWKSQGKHAVLRLVCDVPGEETHMDIPEWLYEKTDGDGTHYDISYGKGFSPNYHNETLIACHKKLIQALGRYYGRDTFVSYVELGSLGHWGEWHVKYADGITRIPKADIREQYITPYIEAFPNAKILMRRPFNAAKEHGFGLYNDMAGEAKETLEWLNWIAEGGEYSQAEEKNAMTAMPDAWKTAPIGGEFTSSISMEQMLTDQLVQTLDLLSQSHTTFLGPKVPTGSDSSGLSVPAIDSVIKSIGYRLRISSLRISDPILGSRITVALTWTNDGQAPMYWDWPVNLYLVDQDEQIIKTIPVEIKLTELIDTDLKTKTRVDLGGTDAKGLRLCIGIVDPMTGEPAVKFAMDGDRIGTLTVLHEW